MMKIEPIKCFDTCVMLNMMGKDFVEKTMFFISVNTLNKNMIKYDKSTEKCGFSE